MADSLIDWKLAERIALVFAGQRSTDEADVGERELRREARRAARLVRRYTGLRSWRRLPRAELIDRRHWALANLSSFRSMSEPIERGLLSRVDSDGRPGGLSQAIAGKATAVEVGFAVGFLSQHVIGQYDVALIGPARPPRLLFVAPNLAEARERLGVDRELFLRWIALHEATHAVQFTAVRWLRGYMGATAAKLLESATLEVKPAEMLSRLTSAGPRELVRTLASGDLAQLLLSESQRNLTDRLVSAMTIIEGYAEHVMDAVGERLDPRYAEMRERLDRDRTRRRPLERIVGKLLGLDVKLSQYARGKRFSDEVAKRAGIKGLNRVWEGPDSMPGPTELDDPEAWLRRVG